MKRISRRAYLMSLTTVITGYAVLPWVFRSIAKAAQNTTTDRLALEGGFHTRPNFYKTSAYIPSHFYSNQRAFRLDLTSREMIEVPSAVPIHSIEAHPTRRHLSAAFSRLSDTASLIDWENRIEKSIIKLSGGAAFYGHGAFDPDGRFILAPIIASASTTGPGIHTLAKIDVQSFKIVDSIAFPFGSHHDITSIGNNKFAVAGGQAGLTSAGAKPLLVIFDAEKRSFETIAGPAFRNYASGEIGLRHLLKTGPGKIVAAATRLTGSGQKEGQLIEFDLNKSTSRSLSEDSPYITGELLSFDVASDGRIWVVALESKRLLVLNPISQKIDHTIDFKANVRSVRFSQSLGMVIVGTDERFYAYEPNSMNRVSSIDDAWKKTKQDGRICAHTRLVKV